MGSQRKRMLLTELDGFTVMDLGDMDIWDGADLALLRDTLNHLVQDVECQAIGVNMTWVKYIPSGFFGMMFDCYDQGVAIRLYHPQPNVQEMLWFRRFFAPLGDGGYRLHNPDGCDRPVTWTEQNRINRLEDEDSDLFASRWENSLSEPTPTPSES